MRKIFDAGIVAMLIMTGCVRSPDRSAFSSCARELSLPAGVGFVEADGAAGETVAKIRIGTGGHVDGIEIAGGSRLMREQVQRALEDPTFAGNCAGSTLTVGFRLSLEGDPRYQIFARYSFMAPNTFVIHTQPQLVDVVRGRKPLGEK